MAFIPNNSTGNDVVSKGNLFFEKAVEIDGVFGGFPVQYVSDWLRIQGMPNVALTAQGTADGNAVTYPQSTVGSVIITLEIATGNAGEFEAGLALSSQKIGEWTCPLTNVSTFDVPALYQFIQIPAKFIRFKVSFLPNQATGNYAKLYVRLHASA